MSFIKSLEKQAADAVTYDRIGLGLLAAAPAYHTYKAIKDKDKGQAALGGTELAGLGLLMKATKKAHA